MAKTSVQFLCSDCGSSFAKWMGRCPDCGAWDTLEEFRVQASAKKDAKHGGVTHDNLQNAPKAVLLEDIADHQQQGPRWPTTINEFDRVLGGSSPEQPDAVRGIVPGSAVLIGGDPGIGKSTLLLQAAGKLAQSSRKVLYVTSEESAQQLKLRADRLYRDDISPDAHLHILADTNLARILEQARQVEPDVIIIDSIQMIYQGDVAAGAGSVTQLRACCLELVYYAKASGAALILVGHVTKQGQLAGPRLLEHMVDTVLYFEGDRYHAHRLVRAIKNRFGTTLEVGLFEMTDAGLKEAQHGAGILAGEYQSQAGSVVCPVYQGTRCLLVELQALVATGVLGAAKRKVSNLDSNRLAVLIAILEKHGGLRLADQDIFVSSVGGIKVIEPACDLALALAIAGAHMNRTLEQGVCAIGEIGLGGELRHVAQIDQRLREAQRLGFSHALVPDAKLKAPKGITLIPAKNISHAIQQLT